MSCVFSMMAPLHARSASGGSPGDHRPLDQDFALATKSGRYGSGSSVESAQSESAVGRNKQMMRLASHMPNSMTYDACEFPRRRYIADRAAGQMGPRGTPGFRSAFAGAGGPVSGRLRLPRDRSSENKRWSLTSTPLSSATSGASSDEVTPGESVSANPVEVAVDQRWNSTTVLDVNRERLLPPSRDEKPPLPTMASNDVREGPSK